MAKRDARERFLAKVIKSPEGCWQWAGGIYPSGYGSFWIDGQTRRANRVSYELFKGAIPEGLFVLHECDNPPCVNPDHLFLGTPLDNMQDKCAKGRHRFGRTCKLTEEDIRVIRASDLPQAKLGVQFGIHQVTVSEIVTRKIWKHI
jgi:hypothetical protein